MPLETDLSQMSIAPAGNGQAAVAPAPSPEPTAVAPATPTPSPTTAVPAAPVAATTPSQGGFSLRDFVASRGYDPSQFQDESQMAAAMFDAAERLEQIEPLAQIGRQFSPYADKMAEFQAFLAEKEEAARKAAEAEAAKNAPPAFDWAKPEYDPTWQQHCQINPKTGMYVPLDPEWALEARKLNQALEIRRQNSERLLDDLPGVLEAFSTTREQTLRQSLLEEARKIAREELAAERQQLEDSRYIEEHGKELFQHDAAGRMLTDQSGQPLLTPKGSAFSGYIQELGAAGVTDLAFARRQAEKLVAADEAAGKFGTPTPKQSPQGTPSLMPTPVAPKRFFSRVVGDGRQQQRAAGLQTVPDDTAPLRRGVRGQVDFDGIFEEARRELRSP